MALSLSVTIKNVKQKLPHNLRFQLDWHLVLKTEQIKDSHILIGYSILKNCIFLSVRIVVYERRASDDHDSNSINADFDYEVKSRNSKYNSETNKSVYVLNGILSRDNTLYNVSKLLID